MDLRFGVMLEPQEGLTYADLLKVARTAEELGFRSLWRSDHFFSVVGRRQKTSLECWTTLAALARETTRIRLGVLCSCNSYRHPSLLAKMAATVDFISGGRLDFGIGAGWYEEEYRAYGIPYPPSNIRLGQLRDAICIIRKMWTEDKPTFRGKHYSIEEAWCNPKPVQTPHPSIVVGGRGDSVIRVAAQLADEWNCYGTPPREYEAKAEVFSKFCSESGRNAAEVRCSLMCGFLVADKEKELEAKAERLRRLSWPRNAVVGEDLDAYLGRLREAGYLIGTPDSVAEQLRRYVSLGVSGFMLQHLDLTDEDGLAMMARDVIRQIK